MTATPPHGEPHRNDVVQKPRRGDAWALAVGLLILLGLFGHLWNQQRASTQTASSVVEPAPAQAPVDTRTEATQPRSTPPASTAKNPQPPKPLQATYTVAHKHRLRDCHGTLTFTHDGLRFDSDEPQDSFAVGRGDVSVEGDVIRIHGKTWRFDFDDAAVGAERMFRDWKTGTLKPLSSP